VNLGEGCLAKNGGKVGFLGTSSIGMNWGGGDQYKLLGVWLTKNFHGRKTECGQLFLFWRNGEKSRGTMTLPGESYGGGPD